VSPPKRARLLAALINAFVSSAASSAEEGQEAGAKASRLRNRTHVEAALLPDPLPELRRRVPDQFLDHPLRRLLGPRSHPEDELPDGRRARI
jgi:hypothetical protein